MTTHLTTRSDDHARETRRYLEAVETFAAFGSDPHAAARAHAARKRHIEARSLQTARKGVRRWMR
jgi:microcystin degradation protein MlrC